MPVEEVAVPTLDGGILEVDCDVVIERDDDLLTDEVALGHAVIPHSVILIVGLQRSLKQTIV